jgi:hypothetical protein
MVPSPWISFDSWGGAGNFLIARNFRRVLEPPSFLYNTNCRCFFPGLRKKKDETGEALSSSAVIKQEGAVPALAYMSSWVGVLKCTYIIII